jgi:hypothetical protein
MSAPTKKSSSLIRAGWFLIVAGIALILVQFVLTTFYQLPADLGPKGASPTLFDVAIKLKTRFVGVVAIVGGVILLIISSFVPSGKNS